MSNEKTKEPLLSDDELSAIMHEKCPPMVEKEGYEPEPVGFGFGMAAQIVRTVYEAARQQDKARIEELTGLVQELVDALWDGIPTDASAGRNWNNALSKAKQLGFTPSTQ